MYVNLVFIFVYLQLTNIRKTDPIKITYTDNGKATCYANVTLVDGVYNIKLLNVAYNFEVGVKHEVDDTVEAGVSFYRDYTVRFDGYISPKEPAFTVSIN